MAKKIKSLPTLYNNSLLVVLICLIHHCIPWHLDILDTPEDEMITFDRDFSLAEYYRSADEIEKRNELIELQLQKNEEAWLRVKRNALPPLDKQAIVNSANAFRRLEGSSNMWTLAWNLNLANVAQIWANSCNLASNGVDPSIVYDEVGRNRYGTNDTTFDPLAALANWYAQKAYYLVRSNNCTSANRICGHWAQLVLAETKQIGCAYNECPGTANSFIFNCLFSPGVNLLLGRPYLVGKACTKCSQSLNGLPVVCTDLLCDNFTYTSDALSTTQPLTTTVPVTTSILLTTSVPLTTIETTSVPLTTTFIPSTSAQITPLPTSQAQTSTTLMFFLSTITTVKSTKPQMVVTTTKSTVIEEPFFDYLIPILITYLVIGSWVIFSLTANQFSRELAGLE